MAQRPQPGLQSLQHAWEKRRFSQRALELLCIRFDLSSGNVKEKAFDTAANEWDACYIDDLLQRHLVRRVRYPAR
jgi:hypothetical protein